MSTAYRSRPAVSHEAASQSFPGDITSIPHLLDGSQTPAADANPHLYAVLVVSERKDRVLVSQVFMSLASAEKKVHRTRERGLAASLTLVRITAVPFVTADDIAVLGGDE